MQTNSKVNYSTFRGIIIHSTIELESALQDFLLSFFYRKDFDFEAIFILDRHVFSLLELSQKIKLMEVVLNHTLQHVTKEEKKDAENITKFGTLLTDLTSLRNICAHNNSYYDEKRGYLSFIDYRLGRIDFFDNETNENKKFHVPVDYIREIKRSEIENIISQFEAATTCLNQMGYLIKTEGFKSLNDIFIEIGKRRTSIIQDRTKGFYSIKRESKPSM